jgi:hypothetical protein
MEEKFKDQIDTKYSKNCVTCGKIFYKKKCLSFKDWEGRKFCSWDCRQYNHKIEDTSKFHKRYDNIEFYTRCRRCNSIIEINTEYDFLRRKYCSKRCSKLENNPSKDSWDLERRNKLREKQEKLVADGKWENPIHKEGAIEKIKETKKLNPVHFSKERLELSSYLSAKRIVEGRNENLGCYKYGKRGYFWSNKNGKNIRYRSSFEKRAFELLEVEESVISYIHEPFYLKYLIGGVHRYYIPDILVEFINCKKLIEVKPITLTNTEEFKAKQNSAIEFCKENGIDYEVWAEVVLFPNRNKF